MGIERGCGMGGGVDLALSKRCRCGRPAPRATWTVSLHWEGIQGESGGGNGLGDRGGGGGGEGGGDRRAEHG